MTDGATGACRRRAPAWPTVPRFWTMVSSKPLRAPEVDFKSQKSKTCPRWCQYTVKNSVIKFSVCIGESEVFFWDTFVKVVTGGDVVAKSHEVRPECFW